MKCPKCGSETSKVKISFFVKGNACSCGWCDFADKIKTKPSLFSRLSSIFRTYKTSSYKWKFLKFRLGVPRLVSKHFARLPLYTEEEPIEVSNSTRPKEEKTKEQPLYKIRKRGWKEKRKGFKIGGSPPMNKKIKVHYLPIPMPKFMASAILALFMIILVGGYQYVHIMYPFIPSIPFLFFLNKPKEKCALKGCNNPVSEDSPISILKGRTLRFCSQKHADIYSNESHLEEYERIQKMYGRRDLLKGIALAGLGAGVAGVLSRMKISEAAVDTTKPGVVSEFSQIGDASVVVFQDSNGVNYAIDKAGVTGQIGKIIASGTGAASVIQQVIDALPNGSRIFLKRAEYPITSSLKVKNKTDIIIEGDFPVLKVATPAVSALVIGEFNATTLQAKNIVVRNIIFHGGAPTITNGAGLDVTSAENVFIQNCVFTGSNEPALRAVMWSETQYRNKNINIEGCVFYDNPANNQPPLVLGGIDGGSIINCYFTGTTPKSGYVDFTFGELNSAYIRDFLVAGNKFIGAYGVGACMQGFQRVEDIWIVGNTFRDMPVYCITMLDVVVPGVSLLQREVNIIGNTFINVKGGIVNHATDSLIAFNTLDTGTEIAITAHSSGARTIILGNVIENFNQHAVLIDAPNCVIKDNLIKDCGTQLPYHAIRLDPGVTGCIVAGNKLIATINSSNAIYEWDSTTDFNLIFGNSIQGLFAQPFIVKAGANTVVKFNMGYKTESSGIATIAAGSTSVTVNHGLAAAPNKVIVTPQANVGTFWVSNITATSFTINVATAPAANVNFYWEAEV